MATKTTTLIENIKLPSEFLDSNIRHHLFRELQRTKEKVCTKKYGVVRSVISLDEILDSHISMADGGNIVKVRYTIENIKPVVGLQYNGKISACFEQGMFIDIGEFQVLVTLLPGQYNKTIKKVEMPCCMCKIGDDISLTLVESEFRDGTFSCVGEHYHD